MKLKLISCLIMLSAVPMSASAQNYVSQGLSVGRIVEVSVIDRQRSQPLPFYSWRSMQFVPGELGAPYSIRLSNQTGQRVMVVLAVDGVNVLSGRNAAARPSDGGYVLDPWETADISGWRKSMNQVAQFYFTRPSNSYAGQTGRGGQVGVIGAAVFQEQYLRPRRYDNQDYRVMRDAPANSPSAMESQSSRSAGTGHGRNEWAPVEATRFVARSNTPAETIRIDYDTPQGLMARGIRLDGRNPRYDYPPAFPGSFVPDPR